VTTIVSAIRSGVLDAELAGLAWALARSGVPIHVAAPDVAEAALLGDRLAPLARDAGVVTVGGGGSLEDVLRQPVPLRPATGAVLIVRDRRVMAAHFQRPPLRDAGGHVRPQGPAVLATWDERDEAWEHFAWGITPELAHAVGQRPGDFEIDVGRRRDFLAALATSPLDDAGRLAAALAGYGPTSVEQ
jgi:hypothetical protein